MSKRELKKDHLLNTGLEVMVRQGYNGTSIKNIVDAAGVPKGSFYTYFASKEDFAIAALEKVNEARIQHTRLMLADRSHPPLERLHHFFREFSGDCEQGVTGGCLIGNLCQEMSDSSEVIRLQVRQMLRSNTRVLESLLEEARQDGSLRNPANPAQLAEFLFNAWEGTLMRMKAAKCREPLDAFLAVLPSFLAAPAS